MCATENTRTSLKEQSSQCGAITSVVRSGLFILALLISAGTVRAENKLNDYKAPRPLKERAPERYVPKEVNPDSVNPVRIDPQSNVADLPYLKIVGYDLKIAFTPAVLARFGLKSGESVPAELLYAVIAAERELDKSKLR